MKLERTPDPVSPNMARLEPVQVPAVAKAIWIIRILNMHPDSGSVLSEIADSPCQMTDNEQFSECQK
jgi:hypothetical protein